VSPACDSCYARTLAERWGFDVWGKDKSRRFFGDKHWNEPLKWDAEAAREGQRARVFCSSMADVFEDRRDLDPVRARLWVLVKRTPNLDWMMLTKRADCIERMLPAAWLADPQPNVWLGVTAENQRRAEERLPALLRVPAAVRWVSAEPLLGPIDFRAFFKMARIEVRDDPFVDDKGIGYPAKCIEAGPLLRWVIVGGESGAGARRMDPEWARDILRQCRESGVAYHFKQKGSALARELGCKDKAGKDSSEWPAEFRVQEFPVVA
jgi:protein gp37